MTCLSSSECLEGAGAYGSLYHALRTKVIVLHQGEAIQPLTTHIRRSGLLEGTDLYICVYRPENQLGLLCRCNSLKIFDHNSQSVTTEGAAVTAFTAFYDPQPY